MAVTATPIFPQTLTNTPVTILPADTTTLKTAYTAGSNGSKLEAIYVTNTDSASAYSVQINITISSTSYLLGTVNVPLSAGNTTAAPNVNLLASTNLNLPKDANGNPYIYLLASAIVKVGVLVAVNSGKVVTFITQGEDF